MSQTYQALEGELNVRAAASTTRTGGTNAVAVVGGYDTANAASDVAAGESKLVSEPTAATETFGTAELPRAIQAVGANGIGTIYGVPVAETEDTESVSTSSSVTLPNAPLFDPTVHPDHEITATDTDADADLSVNVVYDETVATPSEDDTANVNPITGDVEFDASGNYEVTYTYGDYSGAIATAAELPVRNVVVCTEAPSVKATLSTELATVAQDFDFKRGFVGARPEIEAADISSYTPDQQNWRIVEAAPSRGQGADGEVRTCAAVGGYMAAQPIGPDSSGLFDPIQGITSFNTSYRPSEAKDFDGVTALTRDGTIAAAVTTSDTEQFKNIYATEIIDSVALGLFGTARSYAGGPQDVGDLTTLLKTQCQAYARGNPPELGFGDERDASPYSVDVTLGADNSVANAGVSIVPYPIAEEVNLNLTVTDGYVQFEGASA